MKTLRACIPYQKGVIVTNLKTVKAELLKYEHVISGWYWNKLKECKFQFACTTKKNQNCNTILT